MRLTWAHRSVPNSDGPTIHTSLTDREALTLQKHTAGKTVLEIGACLGFSTCAIASVAQLVMSVDPANGWNPDKKSWGTWDDFLANIKAHHVDERVIPYRGLSQEVMLHLPQRYFDVVWIDGDHSAKAVWEDARLAQLAVKPGGTLIFHDYLSDDCPEVHEALDRFIVETGLQPQVVDTMVVFCRP